MNILILGYGKMGKIIGEIAESRGHTITAKINIDNREDLNTLDPSKVDVAIEFSQPEAAVDNITWAITRGIPVVSGTTGWLSRKGEIEALTKAQDGTFFYASNYSIGVNIFFKVNEFLAKLMNETSGYSAPLKKSIILKKKMLPPELQLPSLRELFKIWIN